MLEKHGPTDVAEVIALLEGDGVDSAYFVVDLVDGGDEVIVPTTIDEALDILRRECPSSWIHASYDEVDRSVYLGKGVGYG